MLADIETVGNLIVQALRQGHKVLLCGNGGSAADAQHIAAELVGRFVTERRPARHRHDNRHFHPDRSQQ